MTNKAHISQPVTPHVLRHKFSVASIQKGISLRALQKVLGHDTLSTTEIYLNISPEEVIKEYQNKWSGEAFLSKIHNVVQFRFYDAVYYL